MKHNKFVSGAGHIFNPIPQNDEEVLQHGNALAASGNYPVGTSACFNVGISGGCGPDCFEYLRGGCECPDEMIARLTKEELVTHYEIYKEKYKHLDPVLSDPVVMKKDSFKTLSF